MSDKRKLGEVYYEIYGTNDRLGATIKQSGAQFRGLAGIAKQSNTDIARAVIAAAQQSEGGYARMEAAADRVSASSSRVASVLGTLRRAAGLLASALGIREIASYADAWTEAQNRLRLVTESEVELGATTRDVYRIAQEARTQLQPTAELYARMARASEDLAEAQGKAGRLTETVAKAMRIGGGSAESSAAAIEQFNQALARGELRGEELNSVMEQTPRLAQAIADGLGVTVARLREMAEAGELTSGKVLGGLLSQSAAIDAEYAKLVQSVRSGMTAISNAATRWIGEASEASGAGETLSGVLVSVASNMTLVANATLAAAAAGGASFLGRLAQRAIDTVQQTRAAVAREQQARVANSFAAQTEAASIAAASLQKEREAVTTVRAIRAEQQTLAMRERRIVADLQVAKAAEATARADVQAAHSSAQRIRAEQQLTQAVTRRASLEGTLRANVRDQGRAARELGPALIVQKDAMNAATVAQKVAVAEGAAHTAVLTRVSLGSRLAAGGMTVLRGAMAFLGGPIGVGLAAIAATLGVVAHNAKVAADEASRFKETLQDYTPEQVAFNIADVESRLAVAQQTLTKLRREQQTFTIAPSYNMASSGLVKAYDDVRNLTKALETLRQRQKEHAAAAPPPRTVTENVEDEVKRLASLLNGEIATNKERARAAELVREYRQQLADLAKLETADASKRQENEERRILLIERVNALTAHQRKQSKEDLKDAGALERVLERLAAMEIRTGGGDAIAQLRLELQGLEADAAKVASGPALKSVRDRIRAIEAAAIATRKADLGAEMRQLVASMTTTAVDDMRLALEQLQETMRKKGATDGQLAVITELHERAIAAKKAAEALDAELARQRARYDREGALVRSDVPRDNIERLKKLQTEREGLEVARILARTDEQRALVTAKIAANEAEQAKYVEQGKTALEGALGAVVETESRLQAITTEVAEITRGAIAAASAFGLMNDSTAQVFTNVANIADGVSKLIASGGTDVGAWVQTIGSGINLAANAFGLGERDQQEKANRAANAEAVKELRTFAGALAEAVEALGRFSGESYEQVSDAVADIVRQTAGQSGRGNIVGVTELIRSFGVSDEELQAAAAAHRIELDGTVDSYRRLNEAMQATRATFAEFAQGSLSEYQAYSQLRDKAFGTERTPERELHELLNAGGVASQPLGGLLGGAFGAGGLSALRTELQEIVELLAPGGASIDPTLLGTMTPEEFRSYIGDLLDAVTAYEEDLAPATKTAAERLQEAMTALDLALDFEDVTDPGERFRRSAAQLAATDPTLAALTQGLDLATREGLDAFGERVRQFAADVQSGKVAIDGFTTEQLLSALGGLETAGDSAAAAIDAAARSLAEYTETLEDDLDVQELRNQGRDAEADRLAFQRQLDKAYEEAVAAGVSPALLERLAESNAAQLAQFIADQEAAAATDAASPIESTAGPSSVIAHAGAASVDTLIGIANTQVAELRGIRGLLSRSGALGGAIPQIQPPLLPSAYLAGAYSASAGAPSAAAAGSGSSEGVVVHQTLQFYAPVTGVAEVQSAVRQGGRDIAALLQQQVDTRRRVEGRAEVS